MSEVVVAREPELTAIDAHLGGEGDSRVLLLHGEAGIGKTTLWQAGVERARRGGHRVLAARPVASEAQLSYTTVADLLEPVADEVLPRLAAPRRRALEVVLLLAEPGAGGLEARAVAVALAAALEVLAAEAPLVLAIDDVQWLDQASEAALGFALRRLQAPTARALLAERDGEAGQRSLGLDRAPLRARVRRLPIGPLSLAALQRVLLQGAGVVLPRSRLRRVHEASGGNPFHALEIVRVDAAGGRVDALLARRLAALPAATREVLLHVALLARPDVETVARALGEDAGEALMPAVAAGLVRLSRGTVRFAHPLYATAALDGAAPARVREAHGRLAGAAVAREERARHLARAATGPDAAVAAELSGAAREAAARGAIAAACELARDAVALTPPEDEEARARRTSDAGWWAFLAGDTEEAARLLGEVAASAPSPPLRAEALHRLGVLRQYSSTAEATIAAFDAAIAEAGADEAVVARAMDDRAWMRFFQRSDVAAVREEAERAVALAERARDPQALGDALSLLFQARFLLGEGVAQDVVDRALAIAPDPNRRLADDPRFHAGLLLLGAERLDGARAAYRAARERAVEGGDDSALPLVLMRLAHTELAGGELAAAAELAAEGLELATQLEQQPRRAALLCTTALVAAHAGDVEAARRDAAAGLLLGRRLGDGIAGRLAPWALGHLELALGDAEAAVAQLEPLWRASAAAGIREPGENRYLGDLLEALVATGRLDAAEALAGELGALAGRLGRASAQVQAARGAALVTAARGDLEAAAAALDAALAVPVALPLEAERTRLALGTVLRRARRRREARTALEAAASAFEARGARLWAERARAELGRIGGRTSSAGELTAAERAVAEQVAQGRTNREAAAALFVTDRTVEHHLTSVYAKLGVRSRAELAARFGVLR